MEIKTLWSKTLEAGRSFLDEVGKGKEWIYLTLLTLYISTFLYLKINWLPEIMEGVGYFRAALLSLVMWGGTIYLFFIIVAWKKLLKKTAHMILIGAAMLGVTGYFSAIMTDNSYTLVMDIFFCLMACGKDYKKILRCVMWVAFGALLLALAGKLAGFTEERVKPENVSPGHSFGIVYPNTWGYIAFLGLMPLWYLYMRRKTVLTFAVFWGVTVFMFFVVSCRTISLLTAVFPLLAWFAEWRESKPPHPDPGKGIRAGKALLTVAPVLAMGFTLLLSWRMRWVHRLFYHTPLHTLAMRFVQSGIALDYHGFPVIGHPIYANEYTYLILNGEVVTLTVMDNSFVSYLIMRGVIWIAYTLAWLCLAFRKALKNRDFRLLMLGCVLLVFAMMERPGLDMWYNFILLYPLAKVAGDPLEAAPAADAVEPSAAEASEAEVAPAPEPEEPAAELPSAEPVGSDAPEADQ